MNAKRAALIPMLLALLLTLLFGGCRGGEQPGGSAETGQTGTESQTEETETTQEEDSSDTQTETEEETEPPLPGYDYTSAAPEGDAVDDSYFDDAAFIGDSRTEGMFLYAPMGKAAYLCGKGATVSNVFTKENITIDGADITIMDALAQTGCEKVYLSLGLNELGWNNPSIYQSRYGELIDSIRVLHPGAVIYLQDLAPVNTARCAELGQAEYINNDRIAVYNDLLYALAEEKQVILLKISDALKDETGELAAEATSDGIHLNAAFYQKWCDYLRTHTVNPEDYDPPAGQPPEEDAGNDAPDFETGSQSPSVPETGNFQ